MIYFFHIPNEGQEPVHIHAKAGSDEAKFWLEPPSLAANYGFQARELTKIASIVEEHQEKFREAWYAYFE